MLWTPVWVGSRAGHSSPGLPRACTGGCCERRGGARRYALGAVHSVAAGVQRNPRTEEGRREQSRRDSSKCLVRGGSKPCETRSDNGRALCFLEPPPIERCPAQPLPPPAAVARRCAGGGGGASSLVGAGQSLYQIPLDLPPGGARIRAEARFGT